MQFLHQILFWAFAHTSFTVKLLVAHTVLKVNEFRSLMAKQFLPDAVSFLNLSLETA